MSLGINTEIKHLYGVGPAKARAYSRLGVSCFGELLSHYPKRYENRGCITSLAAASETEKSALILTVATEPKTARLKGRLSLTKFRAFDESASCEIVFFNQNYLKGVFSPGMQFRFYGKVERKAGKYSMSSPAYEPYSEGASLPPLYPVYPLCEGLSQKQIAKDVAAVFDVLGDEDIPEYIPKNIIDKNSLPSYSEALRNIHRPQSYVSLANAKKRLIFDELFTFALGASLSTEALKEAPATPCKSTDVSRLCALLPYELTSAQKRVIGEIALDMSKPCAMSRIIVGDVGCGKTVCAAAAIYMAVASGHQAALMVPTEILAIQHYNDLCELFSKLGISVSLLTSSVTKANKQKIYSSLAQSGEGRIDVVIGTQALITDNVEFSDLALVVTDEQHRFGVNQRAKLSQKSKNTHVLVMSATPIPRTMALALYGDLELSTIDEMPAGRQKVDTFFVDESYRERLDGFIEKQLSLGGQVYIVCPAVEENEDEEGDFSLSEIDRDGQITSKPRLKGAINFAERTAQRFSEFRVAYIHGKMKYAEKEAVMHSFAQGNIDILVSTTVIEVGVNVPNATLMIVENAERFGLSQLHQLRGRVGRGNKKSYCVLVSDSKSQSARERLETMHTTYNGFEIAQKDLSMRGPGDFLRTHKSDGIRQSGGINFRLADLCDDTALLQSAISDARELLSVSPDLAEYPLLARKVSEIFAQNTDIIN